MNFAQRSGLGTAALPVIAAIVVYLPAFRNGFIWDDPLVLLQLRAIRSVHDLIVLPPIVPRFYYRPFIFLTYLIDRTLGGETPFWFHVSVVAWHAFNTCLVFVLARRLFPAERLLATGSALLFAVLPTHVESVAWMAGRSDVIVCAFVVLTVLLFMQRSHAWSCWLGSVTFLLGMLSKEMAVAVFVLVPLLDLLATRRLYWARYLPMAGAAVVYFWLRSRTLGAVVGGLPSTVPLTQLAVDLVRAVGFYVVHTLVPWGLCPYVPEVPPGMSYLLVGCLAGLAAGCFVGFARRRNLWAAAFLTLWFFLTLAPSLVVLIRRSASAPLADRYLYVPTVATCILVSLAVVRLGQQQRLAPSVVATPFVIVTLLFAMQTLSYTRTWTDDLTFWTDVVMKVPGDALPHRELAAALVSRGRLPDAERALQQALDANSSAEGRLMTYSNLGNLYRRMGRYDDAEHALEAAMAIGAHPAVQHNLGMLMMAKVETEQREGDAAAVRRDIIKARDAFEQALRLGSVPGAAQAFLEWDPAKTHALLGQVLYSLGDSRGARQHLEAALRLEPTGPVADSTRRYLQQIQ